MNSVTIENSNARHYSEEQIKNIANLLGVSGEKNIQLLSNQMERAVVEYRLALEDDNEDPTIPPSKLADVIAAPANALEQATNQIKGFPRQAQSDLLRVANEIGVVRWNIILSDGRHMTTEHTAWIPDVVPVLVGDDSHHIRL